MLLNYRRLTAEELSVHNIYAVEELYLAIANEAKQAWLKYVKPIFPDHSVLPPPPPPNDPGPHGVASINTMGYEAKPTAPRASRIINGGFLGFRCASPQALRCRPLRGLTTPLLIARGNLEFHLFTRASWWRSQFFELIKNDREIFIVCRQLANDSHKLSIELFN